MKRKWCKGSWKGSSYPSPSVETLYRWFEFLENLLAVFHILTVEQSILMVLTAFPIYWTLAFFSAFRYAGMASRPRIIFLSSNHTGAAWGSVLWKSSAVSGRRGLKWRELRSFLTFIDSEKPDRKDFPLIYCVISKGPQIFECTFLFPDPSSRFSFYWK